MMGFLGTDAPFLSDLSLVLTWILMLTAFVGAINARRRRISAHCPVMATAALLNWIPVLIIMIPTWLGIVTGRADVTSGSSVAPLGHGVLGAFTQLLMTYTVIRMYWVKSLPPTRPIWLMRITIFLWTVTVLGGTGAYLILYL